MRRTTPTMPVTPAMLRHFAVVTLVITSCIAIFAQGENREFAAQQVTAMAAKKKAAPQPAAPAAQPKVIGGLVIGSGTRLGGGDGGYVETGSEVGGGGGDDGGGGGGGSSDFGFMQGSAPADAVSPLPIPPQAIAGPAGPPPGTPGAPRSGPPKPQPPRKVTAAEIERMMAASRERSGAASSE